MALAAVLLTVTPEVHAAPRAELSGTRPDGAVLRLLIQQTSAECHRALCRELGEIQR